MSRLDAVLQRLNPEQHQAAISSSPRILVLAGAGSGKTSVLSTRVAHLQMNERVGTSNMLCLTFTRLAAQEMRTRVATLIGEELARKLTVGTFHSFCVQVLRQHAERVGRDRDFSIYDQEDKESLLEAVHDDLRYGRAVKLSRLDPWSTTLTGVDKSVAEEYHFRLRQNNAIDLDGLLVLTFNLLADPEIAKQYRERFPWVFVDEYQDTDRTQDGILNLIQPMNLFVVGDPAQSIYGFRGAEIQNILTFSDRHEDCEVIRLERNYRSSIPILEVANRTIADATIRSPLQLWTDEPGTVPALQMFATEYEEAEGVYSEIWYLKEDGEDLSKIAVLCRTNHQVDIVAATLKTKGIETFVVSRSADPLNGFDARRVMDTMAVASNPKDERALKNILNWTRRRVSDLELLKADPEHVLQLRTPGLESLRVLLNNVRSSPALWTSTSGLFLYLVTQLELPDFYRSQGLLNRDSSLRQTAVAIQRWEERQKADLRPIDPVAFLRWIRTRDVQGRLEDPETGVRVMTIHAAKGLEWNHVFMVGCNEGVFPGKRSDPEEERRLFYVAVTRARRDLRVSYTKTRETFGGRVQDVAPSRFLQAVRVGEDKEIELGDLPF